MSAAQQSVQSVHQHHQQQQQHSNPVFLPTAASVTAALATWLLLNSLPGGHGRLNWFVGKTRSYLCHRDTEFFRLQKPEVVKGCREEQATLGQLAAAGGVGRHGHPGNLWTLLILWILVNLSK